MQFSINTNTKPLFVKQVCKSAPNGKPYFVYTLENDFLPNNDLQNRMFRSVIQDAETQAVLSVAPAKSLPNDVFINMFGNDTLRITEIVEGTMINLFFSDTMGGWEIATRNSIGGNYHYFKTQYEGIDAPQITFKQMFLEALGQSDLNDIKGLDTSVCYSFVLQHPQNHIVLNIQAPQLFLVSAYKIINSHDAGVASIVYENINNYASIFSLPKIDENCCIELAKCQVENPVNPYTNVGLMITHVASGMRTALYNPRYLEIKALRGNNPNLHYQYLVLRKVNKVADFLRYFPQYTVHFKSFQRHFELYSTRLYHLYIAIHVTKKMSLKTVVDKRDAYHIEKLHYTVYIPMIKENKTGKKPMITLGKVRQYLDTANVIVPF